MPEPESARSGPQCQRETENDEERHDVDIPVVEARQNEAVQVSKDGRGLIGKRDRPQDQRANQNLPGDGDILGKAPVEAGFRHPDRQVYDWWFDWHSVPLRQFKKNACR